MHYAFYLYACDLLSYSLYIAPGPPENLTVQLLNVAVKISWQPPLVANGIITSYNITYNGSRYETQPVSK